METPQLDLGSEFTAPQTVDVDEWAASIAASREGKDPGYDERVSEAAEDQGFGNTEVDQPVVDGSYRPHGLELPGKNGRGRESLPRAHEVQQGLTEATIARRNSINKAGAAAARAALKSKVPV